MELAEGKCCDWCEDVTTRDRREVRRVRLTMISGQFGVDDVAGCSTGHLKYNNHGKVRRHHSGCFSSVPYCVVSSFRQADASRDTICVLFSPNRTFERSGKMD